MYSTSTKSITHTIKPHKQFFHFETFKGINTIICGGARGNYLCQCLEALQILVLGANFKRILKCVASCSLVHYSFIAMLGHLKYHSPELRCEETWLSLLPLSCKGTSIFFIQVSLLKGILLNLKNIPCQILADPDPQALDEMPNSIVHHLLFLTSL